MNALVLSVLGASLLGSPHCAAMCGGFVCFFSGQQDAKPSQLTHATYHLGRLISYALLGVAAGVAGAGFTWRAGWPASSAPPRWLPAPC